MTGRLWDDQLAIKRLLVTMVHLPRSRSQEMHLGLHGTLLPLWMIPNLLESMMIASVRTVGRLQIHAAWPVTTTHDISGPTGTTTGTEKETASETESVTLSASETATGGVVLMRGGSTGTTVATMTGSDMLVHLPTSDTTNRATSVSRRVATNPRALSILSPRRDQGLMIAHPALSAMNVPTTLGLPVRPLMIAASLHDLLIPMTATTLRGTQRTASRVHWMTDPPLIGRSGLSTIGVVRHLRAQTEEARDLLWTQNEHHSLVLTLNLSQWQMSVGCQVLL